MAKSRLDNIDQFVVETVFNDNGAVKGFTMLEQKQRQVIQNNSKVAKSNKEVATSGFALGDAFRRIGGLLVAKDIINNIAAMDSLNASFVALAGNAEAGADEIRFLREESERLGLNFLQVSNSYKNLFAAGIGAGLGKDFTRSLFTGLMEASTALQLDPRATKGALLAIEQMISKGKVSLEELRRQLGNALPGAMQIASKAMGVTSREFEAMLSEGLDATLFLERFNKQLNRDFGNKWQKGAHSLRAELNRLNNAIFDLKVSLAEGGAINILVFAVKGLTVAIKFLSDNMGVLSIALTFLFFNRLRRAIPILDLFLLNMKDGIGIARSFTLAIRASAAAGYAVAAPFLKLLAIFELLRQTIKMLTGEWNIYAEFIDLIERGTWKLADAITGQNKYKNFKGTFSQGEYKGYFSSRKPDYSYEEKLNKMLYEKKPNYSYLPEKSPSYNNYSQDTNKNYSQNNIKQDVVINVNGAQSPQATAAEIEQRITDKLALGVIS